MTLRLDQIAAMKLGVHPSWTPPASFPLRAAAAVAPPLSYGRIVNCPRVEGFNDLMGDCVPTGCANAAQTFLARTRGDFTPIPNQLVADIYSEVTGYIPGNPSTDNGTDPNDMFAWWMQNDIEGVKLRGFLPLDPRFTAQREAIVSTVGYIAAVCALSLNNQGQLEWSASGTPGSWGYHFICLDQYIGPTGSTSWGEEKWIDESFFQLGFCLTLYDLDLYYAG